MNDRHRFRGMRVDNGEWIGGYLIFNEHMGVKKYIIATTYAQIYANSHDVIPKTVGQCTGEKVKDKLIYDGDILKSYHYTDCDKKKHYLYHRVVWRDELSGWFCFNQENKTAKPTNGDCQLWVYMKNSTDIEIIGTIHEKKGAGDER